MNKTKIVLRGLCLLMGLSAIEAQAKTDAVKMQNTLECKGPGFDYAELKIENKKDKVVVSLLHTAFALSQALDSTNKLIRSIEFELAPESCVNDKENQNLILCQSFPSTQFVTLRLLDSNGELIQELESTNVSMHTYSKKSLLGFHNGLHVELNIVAQNKDLVDVYLTEDAIVASNIDGSLSGINQDGCQTTQN